MPASVKRVASVLGEAAYRRLTMLVVEESAYMARVVIDVLKSLGVEKIHLARTGDEALHILASYRLDMALIDDLEPPLDGLALVKTLRKAPTLSDKAMPVVFMISKARTSSILEARDAGVTEIISKPFSAGQLIARIDTMLTKPRPLVESEGFVGPDRRRREKMPVEKRRQSDRSGDQAQASR
jgi:CheY-like chemotaxis protein